MILSVITIAYNNLDGLKKTLAVFEDGQFRENIEIVIVDGNSTDGTKGFLDQQSVSRNWVSEKDSGIYNAMNKGLLMAGGDYVWFLNSGDYASGKETITAILSALAKKPDAVYGETMMVDAAGTAIGTRSDASTRKLPEKLSWKSFRMGMNVSHQSFIIKRELAEKYDETYRHVADIDWMISSLKKCRNVVRLHRVISCFTMDGYSSQNRKQSNLERYSVLQKHYGKLPNFWAHLKIAGRKLFGFKKL
jgi:glycosyltransferase involved in cell wall biosynthesis